MSKSFQFNDSYKHKGLRRKLVQLIKQKGIQDEGVLNAIEAIPRHYFLDSAFHELAYEDQAMQIGSGQTISQPFTVAYQTEVLEIEEGDRVLEIGLGSGYQACILVELGAVVYSIERIEPLFKKTQELLKALGYQVQLFLGDGTMGLSEHAPYDKIIVTAAAPEIPKTLVDQMVLGGIMVIPVGSKDHQTMYKVVKETENEFSKKALDSFRFVPLIGQKGWKR
ncbi:MAG: protein-L-isoaspartate(D-aspartate) O-methyltransferase [Bacteroidetes bacterium]|nr:protein-L-isoaspartate(D-aspartate) O-methyltransferase [Bacteroidota bacterium]MBL6962970.1 protein-L-isoaspartate(D-aspartate) O-methyltransferase [Bacteroidota bacterium]